LDISVVIPVYNDALNLTRCLAALQQSTLQPLQSIVVDDGSTDDSPAIARQFAASLLHTPRRMGPAAARNRGAAFAKGALIVFLDSDVCVHPDTLGRIHARFAGDSTLDALIGSYDGEPDSPGLVSQYKNLLHHFMHQQSRPGVSTFWTGCGAIRREVFLRMGGFEEFYPCPCIEDIALGYRLRRAGHRIELDTAVQVKHLKRWSVASWLHTDIWRRALPWTRLILRSSTLPDHLNLAVSERIIAVSVLSLTAASAALLGAGHSALAFAALAAAVPIPARFYRFIAAKRGWPFAASIAPLHLAYYLYSCLAFGAGVLLHFLKWRWEPEPPLPSPLLPVGPHIVTAAPAPAVSRSKSPSPGG
jgi:glycosyltransferase involved in cell wall biosynthesis